MNFNELTTTVAERAGVTKALARSMVREILTTIQTEVRHGNQVKLVGFGTFEKIMRLGRTARNPQTGEACKIPTRTLPKFRPGKGFRELVASEPKKSKAKSSRKGKKTTKAKKTTKPKTKSAKTKAPKAGKKLAKAS